MVHLVTVENLLLHDLTLFPLQLRHHRLLRQATSCKTSTATTQYVNGNDSIRQQKRLDTSTETTQYINRNDSIRQQKRLDTSTKTTRYVNGNDSTCQQKRLDTSMETTQNIDTKGSLSLKMSIVELVRFYTSTVQRKQLKASWAKNNITLNIIGQVHDHIIYITVKFVRLVT